MRSTRGSSTGVRRSCNLWGATAAVILMLPSAARAEASAAAPAPRAGSYSPGAGSLLAGTGATTFAVTYLTTAAVGGLLALGSAGHQPERYTPLLVPVAGPFMAISRSPNHSDRKLWWASGGLQVAGLALLATGLLLPSSEPRAAQLNWDISVTPGAAGLRASGRF